jgi:Fe-S cluster assembly protein SufD
MNVANAALAPQQRYLECYRENHAALPGHDLPWLQSRRQQALDRFAKLGFPTPRNEDWKYTLLAPYARRVYNPQPAEATVSLEQIQDLGLAWENVSRLAFINGRYAAHLSNLPALPQGVIVCGLAEAMQAHPDKLEPYLARLADSENAGLAALNAACMADGAFVYLPSGTALPQALHLLFMGNAEALAQPRNLIIAEAGSRADVIEHYVGSQSYFCNAVTEIAAGADSQLRHYKIQEESQQALHIAALQVEQQRGSRFESYVLTLGGGLSRNTIHSVLGGEQAEIQLRGLYLLEGRRHADNHIRIEHRQPHCSSRQLYKGILGGHSRGVFTGLVQVQPAAIKTDARQSNHNLLLSDDAEADSRPQLEILADDVQCSHGATVGQLDDTALFYLRSRGLDEAAARGALIHAFAGEVLDTIELPALKEYAEARLAARLGGSTVAA